MYISFFRRKAHKWGTTKNINLVFVPIISTSVSNIPFVFNLELFKPANSQLLSINLRASTETYASFTILIGELESNKQICTNYCSELVRSTDNAFTTDNEVTDNVVDKAEDFLPSIPRRIEEFISKISTFFLGSVSSLKRKKLIRKKSIENYVKRRKNSTLRY